MIMMCLRYRGVVDQDVNPGGEILLHKLLEGGDGGRAAYVEGHELHVAPLGPELGCGFLAEPVCDDRVEW